MEIIKSEKDFDISVKKDVKFPTVVCFTTSGEVESINKKVSSAIDSIVVVKKIKDARNNEEFLGELLKGSEDFSGDSILFFSSDFTRFSQEEIRKRIFPLAASDLIFCVGRSEKVTSPEFIKDTLTTFSNKYTVSMEKLRNLVEESGAFILPRFDGVALKLEIFRTLFNSGIFNGCENMEQVILLLSMLGRLSGREMILQDF